MISFNNVSVVLQTGLFPPWREPKLDSVSKQHMLLIYVTEGNIMKIPETILGKK